MRVLNKQNDRSIDDKFVFAILVRSLNRISKSTRENCVRPPEGRSRENFLFDRFF